MTTTLQAHGGGAQPASIDTSGKVTGGVAMRVYGFASAADAQAAGYICEGGPAMSVALITDAQIASGAWRAEGDPSALVVYTAPADLPVEGGLAVPVYSVNGWGSAAPAPVAPLFSSAEVGTVNASTVAVTFDQDVSASDYSAGVTIKVNGTATSITSATRQANHAIVYYVIPVLWHGSGDVVTWEYAQASGNIVAEDDSTPLSNVTAQSVTNNCEYAALLDLQADTLALNDGDPISTWADQSGNGNDFTQTGSARPTKQTSGGYKYVLPDANDDWMLGPNFADNLSDFTVLMVGIKIGVKTIVISKIYDDATDPGWYANLDQMTAYSANEADGIFLQQAMSSGTKRITTCRFKKPGAQSDFRVNGNNATSEFFSIGNLTDFSNAQPVRLFDEGLLGTYVSEVELYSVMLINPSPTDTNRAALEARLAARYGVTL